MRNNTAVSAGVLLLFLGAGAGAAPVETESGGVELVCVTASFTHGMMNTVALRISLEKGWHTYWENPGEAGGPLRATWHLPPGVEAGPWVWPFPERIEEEGITTFGFHGALVLTSPIRVQEGFKGSQIAVTLQVEWLACRNECVAEAAVLTVTFRVGPEPTDPPAQSLSWLEEVQSRQPLVTTDWQVQEDPEGRATFVLVPKDARGEAPRSLDFFPLDDRVMAPGVRVSSEMRKNGVIAVMAPLKRLADLTREPLRGVLVADRGWDRFNKRRALSVEFKKKK